MHKTLCAPSKIWVSVSPRPVEFLQSNLAGLQSQSLWRASSHCQTFSLGSSVWGLELSLLWENLGGSFALQCVGCSRGMHGIWFNNGTPLQYSCLESPMGGGAWWAAVHGVTKSQTRLSDFTFTFHFPALEKEMATHSSVLAWRIPGTAEPGGLPSVGSQSRIRLKRLSSSSRSSSSPTSVSLCLLLCLECRHHFW